MRVIDADALMRRLEAWNTNDIIDQALYRFALDRVLEAPTIEERKTGKWIKESQYVDRRDDTIEILRCPICGFKHNYCQGSTGLDDKTWFNYCPNCGARMEGNT